MSVNEKLIRLQNVRVHNLQSVDLTLEKNQLILLTGVSGSGKSSLAFDTLYQEGQRRYVDSLPQHSRRQLGEMTRPDVEHTSGISPTISIEQKTAGRNPRSTVGTMTEIYDYLRVLFARIGTPHCPVSGDAVKPQSRERIIKTVQSLPEGTRLIVLSPYAKNKKGEFRDDFQELLRKGFMRVRVDGKMVDLNEEISLDPRVGHDVEVVMDRLVLSEENQSRVAEAITHALQFSEGTCMLFFPETEEEQLFSMHAFSPTSGISYPSLEPHDFSFNSPMGMCPRCQGLGTVTAFDLDQIIDPNKSIADDCCLVASSYQTVRYGNIYDNLARIYDFSLDTPWKKLPDDAKQVFLYGTEKKWTKMVFVHPVTGATWKDHVQWRGVLFDAYQRYTEAKSDSYRKRAEQWMKEQTCPECKGERLKPYPAATKFQNKRIAELAQMTVAECRVFFESITLSEGENVIAEELVKEIRDRLLFLERVGLHYLTLNRTAPTLSGGEAQRVRLAAQIGCGLVGITYVLDEPSIGLHPRDNQKLITTLKNLRDMGNTVVVVEHDEETIWEADYLIDFGPGAGTRGGRIVAEGPVADVLDHPESLTAAYLTGRKAIPIPKKRRKPKRASLQIQGAAHHNLKEIDVKIPLGVMLCVTGVSGSGKSSLITEILYPALANALHRAELPVGAHKAIKGLKYIDKVIAIDQSPIGRNPRSNPATYIKLFDEIRDLFTKLPESRARGYKPGRFSFNVAEGSCPQCRGMGMVKVDMDFMEDQWVDCPLCQTKRFDAETLSVYYKGKNIYDVLEMEVADALPFFEAIPSIRHKLETLRDVGMEYIKLGQFSTTLSGGEAQRVKLAKELVRPATGQTLYILDEPTTGLHWHDIEALLKVIHRFVEKGNTVLIIEHNMEVVKTADWIIDLGPDGGDAGGEIVASGTPEQIAALETPTGRALAETLAPPLKERILAAEKRRKTREQDMAARSKQWIQQVVVEDAEQNNLKRVSAALPRNAMTIFTGPSGSGKTSLALETFFAEGQRRYTESLSPYARQFVKQMPKPKVGSISGLSPAIAIEQKVHAGNPRSTVGTMTEIYDYLRILYAHVGIPHCPETGEVIRSISKGHIVEKILAEPEGTKIQTLAPLEWKRGQSIQDLIHRYRRQGFVRLFLNGTVYDMDQEEEALLQTFDPKRKNTLCLVIDRVVVHPSIQTRVAEGVETAAHIGNQHVILLRNEKQISYNLSFSVEKTGKSYPPITPQSFAFNTREGMCLDCQGLGYQYGANLEEQPQLLALSPQELLLLFWDDQGTSGAMRWFTQFLKAEEIPAKKPMRDLSLTQRRLLMNGSPEGKTYLDKSGLQYRWVGLNTLFARAGKHARSTIRNALIPLLEEHTCPSCQGGRLNPLARNVTIDGVGIHQLCDTSIADTAAFIDRLKVSTKQKKLLEEVMAQLKHRLHFLCDVGLHYLSLFRRAPTLSGGETQRIRLARQLGSGLTGLLYVLDEPTIGLHPKDTDRVNNALQRLKQLGNTLFVVEHDPLTIQEGDYLLDFGPQAGEKGGHIVARGTLQEIEHNPASETGKYLSGEKTIPSHSKKRPLNKGKLSVSHASIHNLKDVSVSFPIGTLTCLTGVSGSGKSTLLQNVLLPALERGVPRKKEMKIEGALIRGLHHFDKVLSIDQNPIGLTSRSDVGTYADIFPRIRDLYASLPGAQIRGLMPGSFSPNHRKGMCSRCWGMGYRKVEMHFLPPIRVPCDECHGKRLNPLSLEVTFQGTNFGDLFQFTVDEARAFFAHHRRIARMLDTLISVGLGYLRLGQEMASLSGGEAQRIKISRELAKRSTGKTVYLLDEPTTGLHFSDIETLLKVLHKIVDKGNTVIVIEHNIDFIKNADYVVDLGPEAGEKGGEVIATGRPAEIAEEASSWTGQYLRGMRA